MLFFGGAGYVCRGEGGDTVFERSKIMKLELTTATGRKLVEAQKDQLSFPRLFIDDMPVDNMVIIKGKDLPLFQLEQSLYVIAYMKNGDRIRYVGVVRMSLENQVNVQIRNEYGTLMAERRRYFKVAADIDADITGFMRGEDAYSFEEPIVCHIKNINIGGIFMSRIPHSFALNDVLLMQFNSGSGKICVMSEIIRLQRDHEGEMEGYGCRFVNTDPQLEELLAKLVFELQLKQRQEQQERDERLEAVIESQ